MTHVLSPPQWLVWVLVSGVIEGVAAGLMTITWETSEKIHFDQFLVGSEWGNRGGRRWSTQDEGILRSCLIVQTRPATQQYTPGHTSGNAQFAQQPWCWWQIHSGLGSFCPDPGQCHKLSFWDDLLSWAVFGRSPKAWLLRWLQKCVFVYKYILVFVYKYILVFVYKYILVFVYKYILLFVYKYTIWHSNVRGR